MADFVMAHSWVVFSARNSVVVSSLMSVEVNWAIWVVVNAASWVLLSTATWVLSRELSAVPVTLFNCVAVSEDSASVEIPLKAVALITARSVVLNPCICAALIT